MDMKHLLISGWLVNPFGLFIEGYTQAVPLVTIQNVGEFLKADVDFSVACIHT